MFFKVSCSEFITPLPLLCGTPAATHLLPLPEVYIGIWLQWGFRGSPGSWHEVKPSMPLFPACAQSVTASKHKKPDSILVPCGVLPADQVMFLKQKEPFLKWQQGCFEG